VALNNLQFFRKMNRALFVKRKVEESARVVTPAKAGVQKNVAEGKKTGFRPSPE